MFSCCFWKASVETKAPRGVAGVSAHREASVEHPQVKYAATQFVLDLTSVKIGPHFALRPQMLALMLCWIISDASTSLKWHNSESFWEPEVRVPYSLVSGDMDRPGSYCSIWKGFVPILVFVSFAGFRATYLNSKYTRHQLFKAPLPQENYIKRVKRILFFTPYFGMADWGIGFGSEPFEKCSNKNCFVTNKGNPEDFDAILFHARNFKGEQVGHESWLSWDMFHWKILTKTDDLCRFLIREEDDRNRWRFSKI